MSSAAAAQRLDSPARVDDFEAQDGVHCETTTLRNLLHHAGIRVSEPMLFGLGEGLDFTCLEGPENGAPFLTGRTGPGEVARTASTAIGVDLVERQPADSDEAERLAISVLASGHPVGVTVDIYHLDYFASKAHFSAHCVALFAIGASTAQVVDTKQQGGVQKLPIESLRRARASNEGYMPTPNRQMHVRGAETCLILEDPRRALPALAWRAIARNAEAMLADRGTELGVRGIRHAAATLTEAVRPVPDPVAAVAEIGRFWRHAGTGGTNFRGLYLEFLRELEGYDRITELDLAIADFALIEEQWEALIQAMIDHPKATAGTSLATITGWLSKIAAEEQHAFERLQDVADSRVLGW